MEMRDVILNQPQQILHSLDVNKDVRVEGSFDEIILAGMGGSALPGDLLNTLELTSIPVRIHRSYDLPPVFGKRPLIIISTFSGNTEESLSAYQAAQHAGYTILANTAGGTLSEWAQRDGVPWVKIDFAGMQPRHTLLASFTGLAVALQNSDLIRDVGRDLTAIAEELPELTTRTEDPAKDLAKRIHQTVPVYVASNTLAFAAKNFKIQTNENAKAPAFWNEFPELNHNEMLGFSQLAHHFPDSLRPRLHVVMLRNDDDHPRTKTRMDITADLYHEWGAEVSHFAIEGKTLLEKLVYASTAGLWTGYYLAELYGIDPVPVGGVENFKKKLEEVAGKM